MLKVEFSVWVIGLLLMQITRNIRIVNFIHIFAIHGDHNEHTTCNR
jgi:hypothetical protein